MVWKAGFKLISLRKYVDLHLKANPDTSRADLIRCLHRAADAAGGRTGGTLGADEGVARYGTMTHMTRFGRGGRAQVGPLALQLPPLRAVSFVDPRGIGRGGYCIFGDETT